MRWRRSLASEAHAQWVKIFNRRIRTKAHRVQILIDAQITKFTGSGSSVTATIEGTDYLFNPSTVSFTKEFQIAILCVGFGDENRSIKGSDFVSHGFWDGDDPLLYFEEPRLCAEFASQPVLIGGGGDGALGDFITLLTGKRHFSEVIKSLRFTAKDRDGIHRLRMMLNTYYQLGGAKSEHRMLTKVQEEGILLADSMWARSNMKNAVRALLRPLDERPFVQLAMQCHHFSFGYVANRVVAHLLALGLSEDLEALNGGIAPFRLAVRVSKIYGVHGHTCESNKKTCLTGWHHVEFTERNCEGVSSLPEFVDCRRFDRDASRQLAEHPVFTLDNRPKDFRRVLLRFGSPVPEVDTFQNNYCLPPAVAEAAADPNRFRLITPFYPV